MTTPEAADPDDASFAAVLGDVVRRLRAQGDDPPDDDEEELARWMFETARETDSDARTAARITNKIRLDRRPWAGAKS